MSARRKSKRKRTVHEIEHHQSDYNPKRPKRCKVDNISEFSYGDIKGENMAKTIAVKYLNIVHNKIICCEHIVGNGYDAWYICGAITEGATRQFAFFDGNTYETSLVWQGLGVAAISCHGLTVDPNEVSNDIKGKCKSAAFQAILEKEREYTTFDNTHRYWFQSRLIELMDNDNYWRDETVLEVLAKYSLKLYKNGAVLNTVKKCSVPNGCGQNKYLIHSNTCLNKKCIWYKEIRDKGSKNVVAWKYCSLSMADNSNKRIFYGNTTSPIYSHGMEYVGVSNRRNGNAAFFNIYKEYFWEKHGIQFTRIDFANFATLKTEDRGLDVRHLGLTANDYVVQYTDCEKNERFSLGKGKYGNVFLVKYEDCKFADKVMKNNKNNMNELTMIQWVSNFANYDKYMVNAHNIYITGDDAHVIFSYCEYDLSVMIGEGKGSLSHGNICTVMYSVGSALIFFHEVLKLRHADVKPQNILIQDGVPKLSDIGTVSHADVIQSKLCGTYEYLAPELCADNSKYSVQIDTYALGLILVEMIKGGPWMELIEFNDENLVASQKHKIYYAQVTLNYQQFISSAMHTLKSEEYYSPLTLCGERYKMYVDLIYQMLAPSPHDRLKLPKLVLNPFILENKSDRIQYSNNKFESLSIDAGGIEGTVST